MRRLLLDTHTLLWALGSPSTLHPEAYAAIADPDNLVHVSIASLWECTLKAAIGKLDLPEDFFAVIQGGGYRLLPIRIADLEGLRELPLHHRDPFDRLLIAQARVQGLVLVTRDSAVAQYDLRTLPS
jgi:PIN domain nuclease of toxin-antitoxin system